MIPPGIMRRRGFVARRRPGLPLLQRLQVPLTFSLLVAASVTAAQFFTARQLAYRATFITHIQALPLGEEI